MKIRAHILMRVAGVLFGTAAAAYYLLPFCVEAPALTPPPEARVTDRHGVLLGFVPGEDGYRSQPLQTVPQALARAVIAAEDKRFYRHGGVDAVALLRALWQNLSRYDGGDFEDFRDWHICQSMAYIITLQARDQGVGQKMRQALEDYRSVDEKLLAELGRNPTREEIAEQLHMSAAQTEIVEAMLKTARDMHRAKAEQEPKEEEPEDNQAVEDTAYFQARQRIQELLSGLDERAAKLLTLRFGLEGGLPKSPEQTGKILGLTPEEVVAAEAQALSKLREQK